MPQYNPPLRDIQFVIHELLNADKTFATLPAYKEVDKDTINQIVEEAGKFASEVAFPLNQVGDKEGCTRHDDGSVTTPTGFKEAYKQYVESGWPALSCDPEYGGQGLPQLLNSALYETLNSANQSWAMYPGLSHGAYECLHAHGTPEQKKIYLEKLVSGHWTGTMCLTEPQCGTDLGILKTKAEPLADGSYCITGTKIFISSGEHDLTDNIVHLVLARLPDSPKGTKGISLFAVPKFLTNADGSIGDGNKVTCGSIEHKMGIHGNSTCVMNFDGAVGTLVGEPHKGLNAMFVMMNAARLGVGMQGLGLTEVAYQNSAAYAKERLQMRSLTGAKAPEKAADPIIVHPDVRRMLLTQRAYAEGGRAFAYWVALLIDTELNHPDEKVRKDTGDLVTLLTPIIKAFLTDNAFTATNEGLQVFGGQGDMGAKLRKFGKIVEAFIEEEGVRKEMKEFIDPLADIASKVEKLTKEIGMKAMMNHEEVGSAAVPYLRTVGHLVYSYLFARMAKIALSNKSSGDPFYQAKLATARFYFAKLLPETATLIRQARAGSGSLMALPADLF